MTTLPLPFRLLAAGSLATSVLLSACAGPGGRPAARAGVHDPPGFPSQALEDIVFAQARFEDSRHAFGVDLLEEHGIVPVHLSLELRGEGQERARVLISPERMDLSLFLADGTPLAPIAAEDVAGLLGDDEAAAVREQRFRGGLLAPSPAAGFVFFRLPNGEELAGEGGAVIHRLEGGGTRRLPVEDSLVAFNVTVQDEERPLYVGIER